MKGKRTYKEGKGAVSKKTSIQWREYEDLLEVYPNASGILRERIHTEFDPVAPTPPSEEPMLA